MFALDEFVVLALYDRDWHADLSQIVRRIVGLRFLHEADCVGKRLELVRRGRQLGIVLHVPVEAALEGAPGVQSVAVVGVPSPDTESEVMAVVVPSPGAAVEPDAIFRFAASQLPYFMVPRYIRLTDALPVTPTGKVRKQQLRDEGTDGAWDRQAAGLEVRNLGKRFKARLVLREVALKVRRGEAVGLLGPNGAGKTTCFYLITGLLQADHGTVCLDGRDITDLPMYQRARLGIGYLPQEASIFRGLTVEANIRAVLELVEPASARRDAELERLLAEFSLTDLRRAPALELSGGERRRVEIARALASRPSFILLDEPLAGIDPINVNDIRNLVAHLKDRGLGVLITDHNVRDTLDIIDRAYILHEGRVLTEGAPGEIIAHEGVRRVYLGDRFSL